MTVLLLLLLLLVVVVKEEEDDKDDSTQNFRGLRLAVTPVLPSSSCMFVEIDVDAKLDWQRRTCNCVILWLLHRRVWLQQ